MAGGSSCDTWHLFRLAGRRTTALGTPPVIVPPGPGPPARGPGPGGYPPSAAPDGRHVHRPASTSTSRAPRAGRSTGATSSSGDLPGTLRPEDVQRPGGDAAGPDPA